MLWLAVLLVSLQLAAVRVPPVLSGDDEGHSRREGPTREGEVSRGERGGTNILSCGSRGSHVYGSKATGYVVERQGLLRLLSEETPREFLSQSRGLPQMQRSLPAA